MGGCEHAGREERAGDATRGRGKKEKVCVSHVRNVQMKKGQTHGKMLPISARQQLVATTRTREAQWN
jgi:hypothetical protein